MEALHRVLSQFPETMPGIVVVQHMPSGFSTMFSDRLNEICPMEVREAGTGDRIQRGLILIAPGGKHLTVKRISGEYIVKLTDGEKVKGHRPSVDVMMYSVAVSAGKNGVGAILTSMGSDGAEGLAAMRGAGAQTVAQDKESSVVFGMPRAAFECGGAERLVALEDIAATLL